MALILSPSCHCGRAHNRARVTTQAQILSLIRELQEKHIRL